MRDDMRKALLEHSKEHPSCTQKELEQRILQISQGTISITLNQSTEFHSVNLQNDDVKRHISTQVPDLEKAFSMNGLCNPSSELI